MKNKKRSVITVRRADSEIKIYTLRTAGGYESYQCSWYEMGGRRTKTFGQLNDARLFAQQKSVAVANGLPKINQATLRDVDVFKTCENRVSKYVTTLPSAVEEWLSAREALGEFSLSEAVQFYKRHHAGITRKTVEEVIVLFLEAKEAVQVSEIYLKVFRSQMRHFREQFGPMQIAEQEGELGVLDQVRNAGDDVADPSADMQCL